MTSKKMNPAGSNDSPSHEGFEKRWLAYAVAAGAATVGANSADAAIQSRLIDVDVIQNAGYELDIDGDGDNDFRLNHFASFSSFFNSASSYGTYIYFNAGVEGIDGNGVIPGLGYSSKAEIFYSSDRFGSSTEAEQDTILASKSYFYNATSSTSNYAGYWGFDPDDNPAFLGVKFDIGGNDHLGFIELSVHYRFDVENDPAAIHIGRVFYDDNPNATEIHTATGDTVVPEPTGLGLLALGAIGVAMRRRRNSA